MTTQPTTKELNQRAAESLDLLSASKQAIESARQDCDAMAERINGIRATRPSGEAKAKLQQLIEQRKALRVSIALGESSDTDLSGLDTSISEAETLAKQEEEEQVHVDAVLSTLRGRLAELNTKLDKAQEDFKEYSKTHLKISADISAYKFKQLADSMIEEYRRLIGFDRLFQSNLGINLLPKDKAVIVPTVIADFFPLKPSGNGVGIDDAYYRFSDDVDSLTEVHEDIKHELEEAGAALA